MLFEKVDNAGTVKFGDIIKSKITGNYFMVVKIGNDAYSLLNLNNGILETPFSSSPINTIESMTNNYFVIKNENCKLIYNN